MDNNEDVRHSTYPGLDITAGVFPFLRRGASAGGTEGTSGCDGASLSVIFCRLVRRVDDVFTGTDGGGGGGLGSLAGGALRFRDGAAARARLADGDTAVGTAGDSEELAALDDALVTLGDIL